jgi:hypothetical protein
MDDDDEELRTHRRFGAKYNNEVWDLLDGGLDRHSPRDDQDRVLYGAYASLRHWLEVGGVREQARGEHLVSRAAVTVGHTEVAVRHARRCLELVDANPDAMDDWDAPLAHEAVARALAAIGDRPGAEHHMTEALRLTWQVEDPEDRAVLEQQLATGPWFDLVI